MRDFHATVHHLEAPDPAVAALRVQQEVGADVAADAVTAEAMVRARVEAGRSSFGADAGSDGELLARREQVLAAAALPPAIADADVAELRRLAEDLGRAARIRQRTEARFAETLQARVTATTGVALHPATVRSAADQVAQTEQALLAVEAAIVDLGPDPGPSSGAEETRRLVDDGEEIEPVDLEDLASVDVVDPVLERPHDDFDERRLERRRSWTRAAAVVAVALGGGLILVGALDSAPVVFVAVVAVGLVLAAIELVRGRKAMRTVDDLADLAEAQADNLATISAAVASTASGRKAAALDEPDEDPRDTWLATRVRLDAERDEAEERMRVARNRWHQLAGPSADPADVESIIRAHDPQLAFTDRAAETSPTVRTVAAFHRKAQARWKVLWAALGREQAPDPEDLEEVLDGILAEHRQAALEARRLAEAEARAAAAEAVRQPLVLAEPSAWLAPSQLAQLLASVPPEGRVILIERLDADGPATQAGPGRWDVD